MAKKKKREGDEPKRDKDGLYERSDSSYLWMGYEGTDGKWKQRSTKRKLKSEARAVLEETRAAVRRGEDPFTGNTRIEEIYEDYLEYCADDGQSNVGCKRGHFRKWILPRRGKAKLNSLRKPKLIKFRAEISRAGLANASCNRVMSTFRTFVDWAIDSEYCGASALDAFRFKPLPEDPAEDRYVTVEEFNRLLEASPPMLHNLLLVLVCTGARIGEIVFNAGSPNSRPLKWSQVKLDEGHIVLTDTKNKARPKLKYPPINALLRRTLKGIPRCLHSEYVFANEETGRPITYNQVRTPWQKAREAAGLSHVKLHDIRHTSASWARQEGASLDDIRKVLGHRDTKTTERYARLKPRDTQSFGERIESRYYADVTLDEKTGSGEDT